MPSINRSYADVIFPINLNRLTYSVPPDIDDLCIPGSIVEAKIRGHDNLGIVIEKHHKAPSSIKGKRISDISAVNSTFALSEGQTRLLKWVSEYYMCNEGLALKSLLFADALNPPKRSGRKPPKDLSFGSFEASGDNVDSERVLDLIGQRGYKTILYHSSSLSSEVSLICSLISTLSSAIIIVPEKYDLSYFSTYLQSSPRKDHCFLHGGMSRTAISDAYEGIGSGKYKIVIGTMQAVFAPIMDPSVIVVFREHSAFYKHEETPMYNTRDVAVKRGSLEKVPVILTSLTPSFESYFNQDKKKYTLISDSAKMVRPKTRVINAGGSNTIVTSPLERSILSTMDANGSVLLLLNRKGHSILQCNECGHIEMCPECDIPYMFHSANDLRCHYCGKTTDVADECLNCRGSNMKSLGSGTERVSDIISDLTGRTPVLIDSDHSSELPEDGLDGKIILGTERALRSLGPEYSFDLIAMLNADISSQTPDFRTYEKLFQNITYLSQRTKEEGELYIQTYNWKIPFFSFMKNYDYKGFFNSELPKRLDFHYPPAYKLALITVKSSSFIKGSVSSGGNGKFELLGPIERRVGKKEIVELLIKSDPNITVQAYLEDLINKITSNRKDLKVDIDPLMPG